MMRLTQAAEPVPRGLLAGQLALITGASAGIGLGVARRFVEEGATVVITGRRRDRLDAAAHELGESCIPVRSDAANLDDIDALMRRVSELGRPLDVVVANAGGGGDRPVQDMDEATYDRVMDLNVKSAYFTVRKALPLMRDGGRIVLVSSISGSNGDPGHSVYNASKAAVRSLARTFTSDLRQRRIRVNAVSPGPTMSEGFSDFVGGPEAVARIESMIPVGHIGSVDETAAAITFLACEESSYVAGAELVVDGGMSQV
ncbi:SDR family NAD(P)-dependent oxidoreductase [Actinomyces sp. MRS3W]|uniref:SDR family NAD(P)-dependent oxidoreductase n=1 Tax=Actinomyces sp. MRS3W TaxID=2800796 RepID=UPI0028FD76FD|nr:SDR family oxidoreductase [Actinomyces sp. MRS3W]MDU0348728.1 SDR family oxidoreductase [Actinomyces sp. MRS3W]